jgi:hypothetical protein
MKTYECDEQRLLPSKSFRPQTTVEAEDVDFVEEEAFVEEEVFVEDEVFAEDEVFVEEVFVEGSTVFLGNRTCDMRDLLMLNRNGPNCFRLISVTLPLFLVPRSPHSNQEASHFHSRRM